MNKPVRLLMCNEYSGLNSGYSTYGRELLSRLHQFSDIEVAELACIMHEGQQNVMPWKVYPVRPNPANKEATRAFEASPINGYGAFNFEKVCLGYKPHVVIDIRDHWMFSFQESSPFRKYFSWLIMPTVDAIPQHSEWLATFSTANGAFAYTDWGASVLQNSGNINVLGSAPPGVADCYRPMNKDAVKSKLGIDTNTKIIGTVMRNQRRKLFPELFESFSRLVNNSPNNNVYLYCHTSYPDGWEIPDLLLEYGLSSKVLFTYICQNCGNYFADFFRGTFTKCRRCGQNKSTMFHINSALSTNDLAVIYNVFDIYVQYSALEGFGIPMVEAAACGVPVFAVDYSAMSDVVRKIHGVPIKVLTYTTEAETGRKWAVPDNAHFVQELQKWLSYPAPLMASLGQKARTMCLQNYNWDVTATKWLQAIMTHGQVDKWSAPQSILTPADYNALGHLNNFEYARWLICNVLREPSFIGSSIELKLSRDLNNGVTKERIGELYFNDHSYMFYKSKYIPFSREQAYNEVLAIRNKFNAWESKR